MARKNKRKTVVRLVESDEVLNVRLLASVIARKINKGDFEL